MELPPEMILEIAKKDIDAWKSLSVAYPDVCTTELFESNFLTVVRYEYRIEYRLDGELHRRDGPAIIWSNGREEWYQYGRLHRDNGPAITWSNGTQEWWINDRLYRINEHIVQNGDIILCNS